MNGRAAQFLHSTWGAVTALLGAAAVGGSVVLWLAGLTNVPADVEDLKKTAEKQAAEIQHTNELLEWVICTTVPPNRRDVLAALRVSCTGVYSGAPEEESVPRGVGSLPLSAIEP